MTVRHNAVIFDLDGTLVDSAPDLAAALNRLRLEEGYAEMPLAAVKAHFGEGIESMIGGAFAAGGAAPSVARVERLCRRFMDFYEGHRADLTRPYAGVPDTLARLSDEGFHLGICSNRPYFATMEILQALDLKRFFREVLGGDSVNGARKPDPRHLLAAVDALGATVERAIMVGDSENDAAAAGAARVPFIAVAYGYAKGPLADLDAAAVIERFSDLPEVLRRDPL